MRNGRNFAIALVGTLLAIAASVAVFRYFDLIDEQADYDDMDEM